MKISARNALPGKIVDIKMGATTAHVRIDVTARPSPLRSPTSPSKSWG